LIIFDNNIPDSSVSGFETSVLLNENYTTFPVWIKRIEGKQNKEYSIV